MRPILWNDDLNTGVERIDDQHKVLVNTLNEANARLAALPEREPLEEITRDLLSYALYHFETEEQIMQDLDYRSARPEEMARHLDEHRAFSQTVLRIRERIEAGKPVTRDELIGFLTNWLVNHIQHTDKKLSGFILERRARQSGEQPGEGPGL